MFSKIMMPVDLGHADRMARALRVVAELAELYEVEICYVAVTGSFPGAIAHNPQEFAAKLDEFAQSQAAMHGQNVTSHSIVSHDPAVDLDRSLLKACDDVGADLVVMGQPRAGSSRIPIPVPWREDGATREGIGDDCA